MEILFALELLDPVEAESSFDAALSRMQFVADQNFAGMDLFPEEFRCGCVRKLLHADGQDVDRSLSKKSDNIVTELWQHWFAPYPSRADPWAARVHGPETLKKGNIH